MAFEQAGGVEYLVRLAQEDPKTFVPLLIKTMPPEPKVPQEGGLNIHIDLTSEGGDGVWSEGNVQACRREQLPGRSPRRR